jgi:Holliday junction resolvasome RuvABC DNA-binding subunit
MTKEELKDLKEKILSFLTDKNVGFLTCESEAEEFGALIAFGYSFKNINKVFDSIKTK